MSAQASGGGRGVFKADLKRVPKAEVTKPATTGSAKKGLEIMRDEWQENAESAPVKRTRIIDHDAGGRTLFSGTEDELQRLKKALGGKGKG